MTSATPCPICGRTLNGSVCCPDCGTAVEDRHDTGPGPLPPPVERLPATRGAEPLSTPLPELGALPPEHTSSPAPAAVPAPAPGPVEPVEDAPPSSRRRGPLGTIALVVVAVATLSAGGVAAFSLGDPEQSESAPVPRRSQQNRPAGPSSPPSTLPTDTPSPRVAGSDPLPPEPTETEAPAPPPPSPTQPPETTAPPSPTPEPSISWPSGWPTPTACDSGWCWGQSRNPNDPRGNGPAGR